MSSEVSDAYRVKWMRHFSRVTPFLQYSTAADSLLVCVGNILLLRRRIQINSGTYAISFDELCKLLLTAVRRAQSEWVLDTLDKMRRIKKGEYTLKSHTMVFDDDVKKLIDMLGINVFHGCVAGPRYKNIESFSFEDLRYHIMLYQRGQRMEGVRFDESEAMSAETFLKKYPSKLTEKGLQLLRDEFCNKEFAYHGIYHNNRFLTLTSNDDTLLTLMADVVYEPHGCIWEELERPVYLDERFKPYHIDQSQIKQPTPLSTPRMSNDVNVITRPLKPKVPIIAVTNQQVRLCRTTHEGSCTVECMNKIKEDATRDSSNATDPVAPNEGSVPDMQQSPTDQNQGDDLKSGQTLTDVKERRHQTKCGCLGFNLLKIFRNKADPSSTS
ncbi:hypothetical protein, conserved [Babesia bigemina]|uniref:MINDY deubiquitinase domain-containing protein n=1 Tax=Babesia bigemina TaxID=5866 RepID=A0A061D0J0_BABBI|nr:hypothetical protein, conserved [Babesia bigemina]CDR94183.1 hypothetical protein, conserved [Babesia bigemina]|eukprot:XP_012766369.1 hypothetical protein, conserved [Babesia bigemina]